MVDGWGDIFGDWQDMSLKLEHHLRKIVEPTGLEYGLHFGPAFIRNFVECLGHNVVVTDASVPLELFVTNASVTSWL